MLTTNTIRFRRRHLPHWEVKGGRYFVTVRCADSLPPEAVARLTEIYRDLSEIEPRSMQFAQMQRRAFQTLEKFLAAGHGACPLRRSEAAATLVHEFESLREWDVEVPHFTVMPNHWHAIVAPAAEAAQSLAAIMKRLKGRTGKKIRAIAGDSGPIWQGEWFDRWIRDQAEWDRTVAYIRNNPVKAGIVCRWEDHPWTR